eukprot:1202292-Alexandrium_andersonii.AAC.1
MTPLERARLRVNEHPSPNALRDSNMGKPCATNSSHGVNHRFLEVQNTMFMLFSRHINLAAE